MNFAKLANKNLSLAMLFPESEWNLQRQVVAATVVPGNVTRQIAIERFGGRALAASWGYPNVAVAQNSAHYAIDTLQYHVDKLTPSTAVISLYGITYFQTVLDIYHGEATPVPNVVVVHLRRHKGHWMYVTASHPAKSKLPRFEKNRRYELSEVIAAYQPYLRGFKNYDGNP